MDTNHLYLYFLSQTLRIVIPIKLEKNTALLQKSGTEHGLGGGMGGLGPGNPSWQGKRQILSITQGLIQWGYEV